MTDRGRIPAVAATLLVAGVVIALAAGMVTGAFSLGAQPDGDAVVDDVRERYANAETLTGEATVTVTNGSATASETVSFVVSRPDSARLTVAGPDGDVVAGTNGSVAWVYDEANDTARVVSVPTNLTDANATADWGLTTDALDANASATGNWTASGYNWTEAHENATWDGTNLTAAELLANVSESLAENVTATRTGTESVRGDEAHVVRLEPTDESLSGSVTLWADTDDSRLYRVRASYGENATTVELRDQRFDASVHESTFRPPTDASTVTLAVSERYDSFEAAQAETDLALARLDAAGYSFSEAATVTRAGVTVTTQRYDGDNATVAVLATTDSLPLADADGTTVTVAGANATYYARDGGGAVVWTDGDVTRAVAADLPREELLALARSLRE